MTIWPPAPGDLKRPAYRSLAKALSQAIEDGIFRPGDRLPTHRELAYDLGLSVQTVSRAYDELTRIGIIAGEVGRGSFVHAASGEARTPWHRIGARDGVVDCSMLTPVTDAIHVERMQAMLADLAREPPEEALFSFRPRAALEHHCRVAAGWLERCGLSVSPDVILPTNGNTAAMTIALMTAADPGDLVVSEELGHHTLPALARYLGLRLAGLPVDGEGVVPEAFDRVCAAGRVKVLYVVPNGLNPLARMMGAERRAALCEIARRHDVLILENDAGGPIQARRPPPLARLAPERVFYFTGLSKCLMPGLRVGWLVMPETLVSATMNRHLVTNWMATALVAEIATRWISDGTASALIAWQRRALSRRNEIAARAFRGLPHASTLCGLHVWLPLDGQWEETAFVEHARHKGVAIAAGSAFAIGEPTHHNGVRICLGAGSETALSGGLDILSRLARDRPEPALLAV